MKHIGLCFITMFILVINNHLFATTKNLSDIENNPVPKLWDFQDFIQNNVVEYNFEEGKNGWGAWNDITLELTPNPDTNFVNNSDQVVRLTIPENKDWSAVAKWYDIPLLDETMVEIWIDVYIPDTTGGVKLAINEPKSSGVPSKKEITETDIPANTWTTLKFDIAGLAPNQYRQVAFLPVGVKDIYYDNIIYKGPVNEKPVTNITIESGGESGIDLNNGTLQLSAKIEPQDAEDATVYWTIKEGAQNALVTKNGLLTAVFNGEVTVVAKAMDGSGILAEKTFSISNQELVETANSSTGTLLDINEKRMRGTPLIIGKKLVEATNYTIDIKTLDGFVERSLNTVRLGWVDPWYDNENYDFWTLEEALPYLDYAVANATAKGLNIIVNYHTVGEYTKKFNVPGTNMDKLNAFWELIADRYKYNELVYYEVLNEPIFGNGNRYNQSPFKEELTKVYKTIREKAPNRQVLMFSFNNCDETNIQVIDAYKDDIDWDYTSIAYHLYGTDNTNTVKKWMEDYRVVCTEWDYPGRFDYVVDVDGYELNVKALENIQNSWMDWREGGWGSTTWEDMDSILIPDAKANNYWWGDGEVLSADEFFAEDGNNDTMVYPVPFDNQLKITGNTSKISSANLYFLNGQVASEITIDIEDQIHFSNNLNPGIYILELVFTDQKSKILKVVKE